MTTVKFGKYEIPIVIDDSVETWEIRPTPVLDTHLSAEPESLKP